MANINTIKNWFRTGKKPTQQQFWDTWDSFRHKDEKVPAGDIKGIDELLLQKADRAVLEDHLVNANAHAELFLKKEDKAGKGIAGGYAPLNDVVKIAGQYLDIVNDLTSGGVAALLSAEQGKILKSQIDAVNVLLASDDFNLDTVQEIVDAIKVVQTSLNTILVNDLVTGGVTKALTAEQGKVLKGLIDAVKVVDDGDFLHKTGNEKKQGNLRVIADEINIPAIIGESNEGVGIQGVSIDSIGVYGFSKSNYGVGGYSDTYTGVYGYSNSSFGVFGNSNSGEGVSGQSGSGYGISGYSMSGRGMSGNTISGDGVHGSSNTGVGIYGGSDSGTGLVAASNTGKIASFNKNYTEVASVENDGTVTATKYVTNGGTDKQYVKGDGTLGDISSLGSAGATLAIIPIATTTKEGLMSANDKTKIDNLPPAFNAALIGNILAYWDGKNDPTINNQAYPMAKMFRDVAFIDSAAGVRLTPALNSKSGSLFWDFNQQNAMYIKFKFKTFGTVTSPNGADATYFYCYADGVPLQENGGGDFTRGYIVYFSEYQKAVGVIYGSNYTGELLVSGNGEPGKPLIAVTQEGITSPDFHLVEIYIILNRIIVYYEGNMIIDYYDKYDRDISGTKFGFGARTGGRNNNHDIKGLMVQKYSTGIGGRVIDELI